MMSAMRQYRNLGPRRRADVQVAQADAGGRVLDNVALQALLRKSGDARRLARGALRRGCGTNLIGSGKLGLAAINSTAVTDT